MGLASPIREQIEEKTKKSHTDSHAKTLPVKHQSNKGARYSKRKFRLKHKLRNYKFD